MINRPSIEELIYDFLERRKGQAFAVFEITPVFMGQVVFCTHVTIKRRLNYLVAKNRIEVRKRKDKNFCEWGRNLNNQQELF